MKAFNVRSSEAVTQASRGKAKWEFNLSCAEFPLTCPLDRPGLLPENIITCGGFSYKALEEILTLRQIHGLSASYRIVEQDWGGEFPRFAIGIDTNEDDKVDGHVFAHLGDLSPFTNCYGASDELDHQGSIGRGSPAVTNIFGSRAEVWESSGNLIKSTDARFNVKELVPHAPSYITYDEALSTLGELADKPVLYVVVVVDCRYLNDRIRLEVNSVKVNNLKQMAECYCKR